MLDVQMTPMINCDPNEDHAEESDEEEYTQCDSADNLTKSQKTPLVGLAGDTWLDTYQIKHIYKLAHFSAHLFKKRAQYDSAQFFQVKVSALFQDGVGRALFHDSALVKLENSFHFQVNPLLQVSTLFQVGAHCFKSSLRTCSSVYIYICIYMYIDTYIYTNLYIQSHSRVRSPTSSTHVGTRTYTRLRTNTHIGEGG